MYVSQDFINQAPRLYLPNGYPILAPGDSRNLYNKT